ncbi:MAG: hypothetical protein LBO74_10375 [Candidatus Symbiothrix sp.]|nr:hypothetical protein [Candidatus Symbiothrix sp.]
MAIRNRRRKMFNNKATWVAHIMLICLIFAPGCGKTNPENEKLTLEEARWRTGKIEPGFYIYESAPGRYVVGVLGNLPGEYSSNNTAWSIYGPIDVSSERGKVRPEEPGVYVLALERGAGRLSRDYIVVDQVEVEEKYMIEGDGGLTALYYGPFDLAKGRQVCSETRIHT